MYIQEKIRKKHFEQIMPILKAIISAFYN